ncbi:MAG: hypothetical protein Q9M50_10000 [Methylococcales bacterium]|nr:hypothetical protein [Methylococcales bacterium]
MQVSIVNYSELESIALRLDPEYYHPYYLVLNDKLVETKYKKIKNIAFVTDGIHESINFDENSNVKLVSAKAPKENYFDVSGLKNISNEQNIKNPRTQLLENDIIISSVGTIGNCAVVDKEILPANSDRHVGIIRLQNKNFKPQFISTFMLTKYGKFQSLRESTGNVQLSLFVYKINEILVPELPINFQEIIERLCQVARINQKNGETVYTQAQTLLLSELGLTHWQPKHQLTFIKNYSDTQHAERIDAEYYQPKYEEIIKAIKIYSGGWESLEKLAHIKKCIEVGSGQYLDGGVPFVRVSNISPLEMTEEKYISNELYKKLTPKEENVPFEKSKSHQPQKGEILFSKDGTPGIAYYLKDEPQKMLPVWRHIAA